MTKQTYLSADDFIKAITAEREDYEVPGVGMVKIRALSLHEVDKVRRGAIAKKGDDPEPGRRGGCRVGRPADAGGVVRAVPCGGARGAVMPVGFTTNPLSGKIAV